MRINTNVPALNTQRILGQTNSAVARSIGRLSSGFRINRAADDAAGLGIANKLRADIRSLRQAARNAEQANSLLQVAEGATSTVQSILERMKELATQAASDNTDDAGRGRIDTEFDALRDEITRIISTTKFQGKSLLDGTFGNSIDTDAATSTVLADGSVVYDAQISGTADGTYTITNSAAGEITIDNGAGVTQTVTLASSGKQSVTFDKFGITLELEAGYDNTVNTNTFGALVVNAGAGGGSFMVSSSGSYTSNDLVSLNSLDLSLATLGIDGANGDLSTAANARTTLANLDSAIAQVNSVFGEIGAAQNRIDYAAANVRTTVENMAAAESTIRDADMAAEMTEFTRNQILQQAGTAMLAQANSAPQMVLRLLQ